MKNAAKIGNIVHIFGEFEEDNSLPKFIDIGRVRTKAKWSYFEHFHTSYEIVYVVKGKMRYWCNGKEYIAEKGNLYYIQPGQTHHDQSIEEPVEFYYLQFYYLGLNGHINYLISPPGDPEKQILKNPDRYFINLLKEIYKEADTKKPGFRQVIDSILLYMIWLMKRQFKLDTSFCAYRMKSRIDLVNNAILHIKVNLHKKFNLQELANDCNMSTYYIAHVFKEVTGLSPLQYSLRLKIEKAKALLDNSDMTMYEISEHLGFKDQYYFSRTFKNFIGIPPSQYSKLKFNENIETN